MAELKRDAELARRPSVRKRVLDIVKGIEKGFEDQNERAEMTRDHWDAYNCVLSDRQFYSGTSRLYLPFVKDAIEARRTRYVNQLFPVSQRYVEVTTEDGELPQATMALLEHYVRADRTRGRVVRPLLVNGDIEGQYSVYVGWKERSRHVTSKVQKPVVVDGMEVPADVQKPVETMNNETITDAGPTVTVISDNDLLVLPSTVDTPDEAIAVGGSVTVIRRWTKEAIKKMIADGDVDKEAGDDLIAAMNKNERAERRDTAKQNNKAAGIKISPGGKTCVAYEIWAEIKISGEMYLCRIYYAGEQAILSVKRCPYWCDRVPVISAAVDKVVGSFKGRAPVADVLDLQILANDTINEGADTAHMSAMPIVMTDPAKNPRVGSLVLGPAAVWETSPNDTQFAQFPEMWRSAFERATELRQQIFQTLSVNPSMLPGTTGGKQKKNQAEIANEQQVDILQTGDAVTTIEEMILTPMLQRFAEYDHQFRDDAVVVRAFGEIGREAVMQEIEPIQMNRRFEFRWFGVEASRNAAQNQQQIAGLNVLRGIPPQLYPGYKLNVAPAIVQMVESLFGPRIAPLVFTKVDEVSVDPQIENDMLEHGFVMHTHPGDDDIAHMRAHMAVMQAGDAHGTVRQHLMLHQQQMQAKAQAQQAQAGQKPGQPGMGGGAGPGSPGASPSGPGGGNSGFPGAIPQDQMGAAGAVVQPRKT